MDRERGSPRTALHWKESTISGKTLVFATLPNKDDDDVCDLTDIFSFSVIIPLTFQGNEAIPTGEKP